MDRQTYYYGEVLRDTDLLMGGRNAMVGIAQLSEAVLGTPTCVSGFTLSPTGPASLSAVLGPGQVYEQENLEASTWGTLGTDAHVIVKQGIILDPTTLTFTPPVTVGFAQNFLVEVQYLDQDGGSTVLPYYNASNPSVPFNGPGNAGTSNNTVRKGAVAIQVKAGTAATAGTQVTPSPDAGWAGLFVVTLAQGATTVTAGNITQYSLAPFITTPLPRVPAVSQSGAWSYAGASTNSGNAFSATLSPIPTSLTTGMRIVAKMSAAPTGPATLNVNALGNVAIVKSGGAALGGGEWATNDFTSFIYTGAAWQITNSVATGISSDNLVHIGDDTSSVAGAIVATVSPAITAYNEGALYNIKIAKTTLGATTANFNSLGARTVTRQDGSATQSGDFVAGQELILVDQGSHLQLASLGRAEVPRILTTAVLYVRTDGNDANDGSANDSAHAFATIQQALTIGATKFFLVGGSLTIQLGNAGTYAAPTSTPAALGTIILQGDVANQGSYIVAGAGGAGLAAFLIRNAKMTIQGITIQNTGTVCHTMGVNGGGVTLQNVTFTSTSSVAGQAHLFCGGNGSVTFGSGCVFASSMGMMIWASTGNILMGPNAIAISGAPNFSSVTALCENCGVIALLSGLTFTGTAATGIRYTVDLNGVINAFGGGTSILPGSSAGSTATGGQYAP